MRATRRLIATATVCALLISACAGGDDAGDGGGSGARATAAPTASPTETTAPPTTAPPTTVPPPVTTAPDDDHPMDSTDVDPESLLPAYLGAAAFQDVEVAESAGWVSTAETLGCFENDEAGGMGLHWLNESLLDAEVDAAMPEALVYELDAAGDVVGLVGHEYLVPLDAWTDEEPPNLFGLDFHEHPVLPFWFLHAWLWKENPAGMFTDWNPAVRMCPDGVGVFGVDLP